MTTMPFKSADDLLAAHGRNAMQMVISEIVAAVKRGDEDAITAWDAILRGMERKLGEDHDARIGPASDEDGSTVNAGISGYAHPTTSRLRFYGRPLR